MKETDVSKRLKFTLQQARELVKDIEFLEKIIEGQQERILELENPYQPFDSSAGMLPTGSL